MQGCKTDEFRKGSEGEGLFPAGKKCCKFTHIYGKITILENSEIRRFKDYDSGVSGVSPSPPVSCASVPSPVLPEPPLGPSSSAPPTRLTSSSSNTPSVFSTTPDQVHTMASDLEELFLRRKFTGRHGRGCRTTASSDCNEAGKDKVNLHQTGRLG